MQHIKCWTMGYGGCWRGWTERWGLSWLWQSEQEHCGEALAFQERGMVSIRHTQYPGGITVYISDIMQCVHGWVTGWEGVRERMKALQAKESECYSIGSHWRAFRKGVKWSDAHLRKIALIGREKLDWKGGAMEFSGEAPPCGLSESWCTLSWRSSSGNEEEAWTQSGQDLVRRKPMAMAAEKWGGEERGGGSWVLSDFWQGKCRGGGTFNWDGEYRQRVGFVIVGLIFKDGCGT